jgi:uroporphyrinogen-III synthase
MTSRLDGARVLLTRRMEDVGDLASRITALGGHVTCAPMIQIAPPSDPRPLEECRGRIGEYDWVALTSRHAARALLGNLPFPGSGKPRIAVVGASTAEAVRKENWDVNVEASGRGAAALAEVLADKHEVRGANILYPTSNLGRDDLDQRLEVAGARITRIEAYRTIQPEDPPREDLERMRSGGFDITVFASPSAVANFGQLAGVSSLAAETLVTVSIGTTTSAALREAGARRIVEAKRPDTESLLDAVREAWNQRQARRES